MSGLYSMALSLSRKFSTPLKGSVAWLKLALPTDSLTAPATVATTTLTMA